MHFGWRQPPTSSLEVGKYGRCQVSLCAQDKKDAAARVKNEIFHLLQLYIVNLAHEEKMVNVANRYKYMMAVDSHIGQRSKRGKNARSEYSAPKNWSK